MDPATISLGLSALSGGINLFRQFNQPSLDTMIRDLNRQIDQQMHRALRDTAEGVRRRSVGAGLEGSGALNAQITDALSRVREGFESQRTAAINALKQYQFGAKTQQFGNVTDALGDLTGIGLNTYLLTSGALQPNLGGQQFPSLNFGQASQAGASAGFSTGSLF